MNERFWDKVATIPFHGCWEWTAYRDRSGYGCFKSVSHPSRLAHRTSYEINRGPIPPGADVLHSCDNRSCVNPDHLFLGDQTINNRDRDQKGRTGRIHWSRHPSTKLSWDDVVAIRQAMASGERAAVLALRFGVHVKTIGKIVRGRRRTTP